MNNRTGTWVALIACAAVGGTMTLHAQNSQQTRMTSCNAQAKTKALAGDDRKQFMKSCLSSDGSAPAPKNSQQQKMKDCNTQATAKTLKGDDRKAFMSQCLKGG